jgi:LPXTG-motif cell wall-anchored protein
MRSRRHWIACLLAAAMLALPGSAAAQSAGDEQYEDPFAPEQSQEQPQATPEPAPAPEAAPPSAPAPAAPAPEPAAEAAAAQPAAAEQLPYTGADAGVLALGGALLLAGGIALRVRLREQR